MAIDISFKKKSNQEIKSWLEKNQIGLNVSETRRIETGILKRSPTLTECYCFAIEGSEHCSYRSSKKYLKLLPTNSPDVILGPKEDAGIVAVAKDKTGECYGIVISHESHNHPSQVVPYEGAATGIGGNVRDVACMGAKVIALADALRFGDSKQAKSCWVANGVISGIAGYGNPIGVPNITGDVYFNPTFNNNCLVNVVTLGVVKESEVIHSFAACGAGEENHDIILVGKPTDNSGFGGAAFASFELDQTKEEQNKGAVQEPNAFLKRHLLVSTYDLFEKLKTKKLLKKVGFKDIGGGGILCGSVEITGLAGYGAEIWLEKIHLSMKDLPPTIILCSETQERFIWTCPKSLTKMILKHYNQDWALPKVSVGAQASVIGRVTLGNYVVKYQGRKFVDVQSELIRKGLSYNRKLIKAKKIFTEPKLTEPKKYQDILFKLLALENIACQQPIYEQYDKNVQGQTIIERGQANSGLIAPFFNSEYPNEIKQVGVALSVAGNPRYGEISPYWQAVNAVCEAMKKVASLGAKPVALTDCLNYGNPEKPQVMWQFVEGVKGVAKAAKNIHLIEQPNSATPIISGNVSFYNESDNGAIAPQAIISCIGKIKDFNKAQTLEFKNPNHDIWLIGERKDELGGSAYYSLFRKVGAKLPKPNFAQIEKEINFVVNFISQSLITACNIISDGGMIVSLAKMCFGGSGQGKVGLKVNLESFVSKLTVSKKLFSETGGFIFSSPKSKRKQILNLAAKISLKIFLIGQTTKNPELVVKDGEKLILKVRISKLAQIWLNGLRNKL